MAKRYKVDEINLEIVDVIPFVNDQAVGFVIQWASDIGWGEYSFYKFDGSNEWAADSEGMDNDEDNDFVKELMRLFIEKLRMI